MIREMSDCDQVITSRLKLKVNDDEYGINNHSEHKLKGKNF